MKKSYKKSFKVLSLIVVIIVVVILSLNFILSAFVRGAVNFELNKINSKSNSQIDINKIKINLFSRTLILKDISVKPDSSFFEKFKIGDTEKNILTELSISDLRLRGLNISEILMNRHFELHKIIVKDVSLIHFKRDKFVQPSSDGSQNMPINLDSIHIARFDNIDLSKIEVNLYKFKTINVNSEDTLLSYQGNRLEINGINLDSYSNSPGYFKFNNTNLILQLQRQRFDLKGGDYYVYFDKLDYRFGDSLIKVSNFMFKPSRSVNLIASSLKFAEEVFDVNVDEIYIHGFKLRKAMRNGILDIDSVVVNKLNVELFKDKNKPFNLKKRPLFLQQTLKKINQPIHINKIFVKNSYFKYSERQKNSKSLMVVEMPQMNAVIGFVTSIKDSLRSGKNLSIILKAKLMGVSNLNLNLVMPYNSRVDTFYYAGSLSTVKFKKFNSVLYPVSGIKFTAGTLNSIQFNVNASPKRAEGQMTMLYEGLQAEITKADVEEKNKALSWIANTVLPVSNPSKKGKLKVAKIEIERIEYKGLGNFVWKSVQSGLMNTIIPFSKQIKQEDDSKKTKKKSWFKRNKKD